MEPFLGGGVEEAFIKSHSGVESEEPLRPECQSVDDGDFGGLVDAFREHVTDFTYPTDTVKHDKLIMKWDNWAIFFYKQVRTFCQVANPLVDVIHGRLRIGLKVLWLNISRVELCQRPAFNINLHIIISAHLINSLNSKI